MSTKEPREMSTIQKEYAELIGKVGQAQYQREIFDPEVKQLNERLYEINVEAAKRNQLDAASTPVTEVAGT